MSALGDALSAVPPTPKPKCTVGQLLEQLDPDSARDLRSMLDARVDAERLATALAQMGFSVKGPTLNRHARGKCMCPR